MGNAVLSYAVPAPRPVAFDPAHPGGTMPDHTSSKK